MRTVAIRTIGCALAVATLVAVCLLSPSVPSASASTESEAETTSGPILPIPDTLWRPADGSVPETGNYVYFDSDPEDPVGWGEQYLYTQANALLKLSVDGGKLDVQVKGDESWYGDFETMAALTELEPGYYPDLERWSFHDPATGGVCFSGMGRGPGTLTGWVAIDEVTCVDGSLVSIDLRFEQHAEGGTPALHGEIHWRADDPTQPPGPVVPVPDDLWRPAEGSVPATGSYVYLDFGDVEYLYTQADSVLRILASGGHLDITVDGDESWSGDFEAMYSLSQLEPGYYSDLGRYPLHNPAVGGLYWGGEGRGFGSPEEWVAVDEVTYVDDALASIDLRFAVGCSGDTAVLYGQIHWRADDPTQPPGPVMPVPDELWRPSEASVPASGSYVYLDSDDGDYIGAGGEYLYTEASAELSVSANGRNLEVEVDGEESWDGRFETMLTIPRFEPGYYPDLQRYPFNNPAKGGLSWSGEGRGSTTLTGWFAVDEVTYVDGVLASIDLRFEQHSSGVTPALRGEIHWRPDEPASSLGPVVPIPESLWRPAEGATPERGTYAYLESEGGDYLYTQESAVLSVSAGRRHLDVLIEGDESWDGDFEAMATSMKLEPGYYPDLLGYPAHDPTMGGLSWAGQGHGGSPLTGWFALDSVTYVDNELASIDLRFEQSSSGGVLRGEIHWRPDEPIVPPGPVVPIPDDLWRPAEGSVPESGSYVYLDSDEGDFVGAGRAYLYTQADAVFNVSTQGGRLNVQVTGDESWDGEFEVMTPLAELLPGYYPDLQRCSFHDPTKGGLDWSGEGRGSGTLTGWFAVDDVTYTDGALTSLDLRFEQHSEGATPALHGEIHWRADDPTQPPGPVVPIPDDLWRPAEGSVPESGSYVYLDSDTGDYIGAGGEYLYTQADALLRVTAHDGHLDVSVDGDESWDGEFETMISLSQLERGYYPDLQRCSFHNPVKGGLRWSGEGRGSNTLTGWFAIDSVTYVDGALASIDLRFEQHSEGATPALHGEIHWRADDPTQPPGPVVPVPDTLWRPAEGSVPESGSYVYLDSETGDYIGAGRKYLYAQANAVISVSAYGGQLDVRVTGDESWSGDFETMISLSQLEPGYYPDLQRCFFHNPVKGGLKWSGEGRASNTLTGWFAVDSVTYVDGALASIDLRFEQHSGGAEPALHGEIHWSPDEPASPLPPMYTSTDPGDHRWSDPVPSGRGDDEAVAVVTDAAGNAIVVGDVVSSNGDYDIGYRSYLPDGTPRWGSVPATWDGSGGADWTAGAVADGPRDCVYVAGTTESADGDTDVVILKLLNETDGGRPGGTVVWARTFDAAPGGDEEATAIARDKYGNVYVTGYSQRRDGSYDLLVLKYGRDGRRRFAKRLNNGGVRYDAGHAIAVRGSSLFVAGVSERPRRRLDIVLLRYSLGGSRKWVRYYDDSRHRSESVAAIALTSSAVYLCGSGKFTDSRPGDALLLKYGYDGRRKWVRYTAGNGGGDDIWTDVAVDRKAQVHVTGACVRRGSEEDIVTRLYSSSGRRLWQRILQTAGSDVGTALAVDSSRRTYVCGWSTPGEDSDAILVKYGTGGATLWETTYPDAGTYLGENDDGVDWANDVAVFGDNVYLAGGHDVEHGEGLVSDFFSLAVWR